MAYATTVSRRRLGNRLRSARVSANFTAAQVAAALDVSHSTIIRMEKGQVGVRPDQLDRLVGMYGVIDQADELVELNRKQEKGWWTRYASVLQPGYYAYVSFEAEADEITTWEPTLVPGFLQTEAYYRAMMRGAGGAVIPESRVEALLEVRLERQRHLEATDPAIEVVIGEPVLHWVVGDLEVMTEQRRKLLEAADRMSIRVVPFQRGADIAGFGGITVLRYSDGLEVVWGETVAGDSALEEDRSDLCLAAVEHLRSAALDEAGSLEMLKQALERSA